MSSQTEDKISSSANDKNSASKNTGSFWRRMLPFERHMSLTMRTLLTIIPLLLLIFIISTAAVQTYRNLTFDKQVSKLHNAFTNLTHDQSAFMLGSLRNKEKSLASFLSEISKTALKNRDSKRLKQYSDLMISNNLITYVGFFSVNHQLLADSGLPNARLKLNKYPVTQNGKKLGYLVTGVSEADIQKQQAIATKTADKQATLLRSFLSDLQKSNQLVATIIICGIIGIISLFIAHYFHSFITNPIAQCVQFIKGFQEKQYNTPLPYQHKQDEIGEIARALETFRQVLIENDRLEQIRESQNKALIDAKEEAEQLAYIDELTCLPNRSCCNMDAMEKFSNAQPHDSFALIYIDLNDFKRVNDTLGHSAGDSLLAEVARRLSILTRSKSNSSVYRWGGDEFVIIYDRNNGPTERFCLEVINTFGIQIRFGSHTLWPNCSMGISKFPEDGDNFETLMVYADLALHKNKLQGNDYHFFTKELKQKIDEESRLEKELTAAIEANELFLVYQPQIDSDTLEVRGIEALIRWAHPERGVLTPWHFLDVIENSRLAPIVGAYVFNEAFQATGKWLEQGLQFGRISVNLSPNHLKHGSLIHDLKTSMKKYNIQPENVAVEVLESLLLDRNDDKSGDFISILSQMDVHIELDDFGTGYASLSHLSTLPIDGLKIDRSFTNQILTDEKKAIVVQSLLNLTKSMNIDLVCEGVETLEQMRKLRTYGECALQGYLIAKPMNFKDMTGWLERNENLHFFKQEEKSGGISL